MFETESICDIRLHMRLALLRSCFLLRFQMNKKAAMGITPTATVLDHILKANVALAFSDKTNKLYQRKYKSHTSLVILLRICITH